MCVVSVEVDDELACRSTWNCVPVSGLAPPVSTIAVDDGGANGDRVGLSQGRDALGEVADQLVLVVLRGELPGLGDRRP